MSHIKIGQYFTASRNLSGQEVVCECLDVTKNHITAVDIEDLDRKILVFDIVSGDSKVSYNLHGDKITYPDLKIIKFYENPKEYELPTMLEVAIKKQDEYEKAKFN